MIQVLLQVRMRRIYYSPGLRETNRGNKGVHRSKEMHRHLRDSDNSVWMKECVPSMLDMMSPARLQRNLEAGNRTGFSLPYSRSARFSVRVAGAREKKWVLVLVG